MCCFLRNRFPGSSAPSTVPVAKLNISSTLMRDFSLLHGRRFVPMSAGFKVPGTVLSFTCPLLIKSWTQSIRHKRCRTFPTPCLKMSGERETAHARKCRRRRMQKERARQEPCYKRQPNAKHPFTTLADPTRCWDKGPADLQVTLSCLPSWPPGDLDLKLASTSKLTSGWPLGIKRSLVMNYSFWNVAWFCSMTTDLQYSASQTCWADVQALGTE